MSYTRSTKRQTPPSGNGGLEAVLAAELPRLIAAGLKGDPYQASIAARRLLSRLGEIAPTAAAEIQRALTIAAASSGVRQARPVELQEASSASTASDILTIKPADAAIRPVLSDTVEGEVEAFIAEHEGATALRARGLEPRWSLLLTGPPGTGKTMLARWIASRLRVPLGELQLSAAISSYFGRTGQNLSEVLEVGRRRQMVLLLDEFDALAKRRDDAADLGELKRVVSVLLKELEEWHGPSVIIAATNHPELLDPAVFRRFQLTLAMDAPDAHAATAVLSLHFQPECPSEAVMSLAAGALAGNSGSDLRQFAQNSQRRALLQKISVDEAVLYELARRVDSTAERRRYCQLAVERLPRQQMSMERLAQLLGIAKSTVHSYLSE